MAEGNLSPLIIKYEKLLEEDPRSRVFAPLAEAYRKVGLIENAFQVLKKGLRFNPDYLLGYLSLAQCYMDKGEVGLAYTTLRPLVAQYRDNIKLQKLFAESSYRTENFEESLDTYKYLLYLQPKEEEVAQKVKELEALLSEDIFSPQHPEEITFDVDDLKVSPESDKILDDWVQLDLSREEETDSDDSDSVEEKDDWSMTSSLEDSSDFYDDDYNEETADGMTSSAEQEITPVITHTLVDLYLKQGHAEKAKELLEKILEIQPNNPETLQRLEALHQEDHSENEDHSLTQDDEGRGNLLAALDKVRIVPEDSEEDSEGDSEDSSENEGDQSFDLSRVKDVLSDFHNSLQNRAKDLGKSHP